MRVLLLAHAFNSLTQRLFVELRQRGHQVSVEFDIHDQITLEAVTLFKPDLIIAPYLKRAIPDQVWRHHCCLVLHPGLPGDRGPSALDWAIINAEPVWGVTVLQANGELDGGDIWAAVDFPMRDASKSSLYRNEVTEAAVEALLLALERYQTGNYQPQPLSDTTGRYLISGKPRPLLPQSLRTIDWQQDDTITVLRKIRSADGTPGVRDESLGRTLFLYDAHPASMHGPPGRLLARCHGAVARATADGAVWLGHLRDPQGPHPFKLPATQILQDECRALPEHEAGYPQITYQQRAGIGYLHFPFYNGAMDSKQCQQLLQAYQQACQRETRILVLMGGADFWSNGMHLNRIEAAPSAADASWENIQAMDDLAEAIITTESHLTIAALQGNAGAGGIFLARAADLIWARSGVVLNPHYKDMGNLYGSEYWSYLLPRYAGEENARRITEARLPMGTVEALELGLIDAAFGDSVHTFVEQVEQRAEALLPEVELRLHRSNQRRHQDQQQCPLQQYRQQELEQMQRNFYGFDPSYHVARYNFVYKVAKSRTPATLALHRRQAPTPPDRD